MAERYNKPFELGEIGAPDRLSAVHEALRRRPVGGRDPRSATSGSSTSATTHPASGSCTCSGRSSRSTSSSVPSPSGPETMSMRVTTRAGRCTTATRSQTGPSAPETGFEVVSISEARERLLPVGVQLLRDDRPRQRGPSDRLRERVAGRGPQRTLHYYFPWAIRALVRWSAFCAITRREMRIFQDSRAYFAVGDDEVALLRGEGAAATVRSRTTTSRPTSTRRSAVRRCPVWTRRPSSSWSPPSSTTCSSTPCARRSRSTSTSTSWCTTAGCSPRGRGISAPAEA